MKLSIIIVNYNVRYFLEQALLSVRRALEATPQVLSEVFVVDNNSVDDSVEMVRDKFPEVILIANKQNTGFAVANNQAMRLAKGEYVLLLNPDTVVREDTFAKCTAFMDAHPMAGGLGVKMIDGSGAFLPESKRGFPSPMVAFYKTFGFSTLFPKSARFNRYALGHLDPDENHEVEVLAGAFMWMRKSVLDKIGLLDEAFFMYGEDIDLSYRIVLEGFKNYYFADTTIIHYKGESTKKGSLNYVKTFYNAMMIFARKHFKGKQATAFIALMQGAIWFRAGLTLFSNLFQQLFLPVSDALLIFGGMYFLKNWWANYYFQGIDYYHPSFLYFNIPLYIVGWLSAIYFSGGYDAPVSLKRILRGIFWGTIFLAAIYGFLPLEYRVSRMLLLLGAVWTMVAIGLWRVLRHFFKYKNFQIGIKTIKNLAIVGSIGETERVQNLLNHAQIIKNIIGRVEPNDINIDHRICLGSLEQLDEIVRIYKINEIIFCSKDVSSNEIMAKMTTLGSSIEYKILPEESLSIIGSSDKNTAGAIYTIDIQFKIDSVANRRNKRLFDMGISLFFLMICPMMIWFLKHKMLFLNHCFQTFIGRKTWIGYAFYPNQLPQLKQGVFTPSDGLAIMNPLNQPTIQRIDFLYAKDYDVWRDVDIILRNLA
jgi:GT2 family glycosyltransferase